MPLKSTRADVERLMGPTKDDYYATYQLKQGNLSIVFSTGPCSSERKGGWNVPKGIVTNVIFSPKDKRPISELKLDSHKFRKVRGQHVRPITYYVNKADGITYEVQDGRVDVVEYGPVKTDKYFPCSDAVDPELKRPSGQAITPAPTQP